MFERATSWKTLPLPLPLPLLLPIFLSWLECRRGGPGVPCLPLDTKDVGLEGHLDGDLRC